VYKVPIGKALGLNYWSKDVKNLKVIKQNNGGDAIESSGELWLHRQPRNQLLEALRAPSIDLTDVASKIEGMLEPSTEGNS